MIHSIQKFISPRSSRINTDTERGNLLIRVIGGRFLCCSAGEWQQGDISRLLYGQTKAALVRRAHTGQTPGHNFAAFGDELRQQANVLVIDRVDFLDTEFANFLATEKFPPAGSTFAPTGSGWTPLSAV
jgi:hypothetical protein